jgi:hypothetical protein
VKNGSTNTNGQATILALDPLTGGQDDAVIAGPTFRADNIGFPHAPNMRPESPVCHHFRLPMRFFTSQSSVKISQAIELESIFRASGYLRLQDFGA